ncbi:hypothetical protein FGG08_007050 [Glutinoglossum americanum]|uniref:NmrA-like domain-containing protein n=1 Tax=Glutinoglossum americanum TaxID=1670608 RepID=A0A9P8KUC4_9PEZI|nr:hypothetical protein FGG08_007050 [Glutinoglossum americanum]
MTVLLLGGTGKTSSRISLLLGKSNIPVILASRSGSARAPFKGCTFDWFDASTYNNPFNQASDITAIYLIPPFTMSNFGPMKTFTELALSKGVQRLVLLSGSIVNEGDPGLLQFHDYIKNLGVDYCILRPTWFMENFSEVHDALIRDEHIIRSATCDGKIPWVSADDVAAVAYRALVDEPAHNTEHFILGPELFSFDDVAQVLSGTLGRKITHVRVSEAEAAADLRSANLQADYAQMLAALDTAVANGVESRLNDEVLLVTGRSPKTFQEFVEVNKKVWV